MRLGVEPDFEVVGQAEDGRILDQVEALSPDVVLMDVSMPVMDGIEATAALTASPSRAAVVMLSLHDDARVVGRALAAGAVGFVAKDGPEGELAAAIRRAAREYRKARRRNSATFINPLFQVAGSSRRAVAVRRGA